MQKKTYRILSILIGLATLLFSSGAQARTWEEIVIPGAKCGNGSDYSIYLSQKNPKKVAFYFQGGGACWDFWSCSGPLPLTPLWIPRILYKYLPDSAFLADEAERTPISDHTVVYFPYCTGDVFAGSHIGHYGWGSNVYHWGAINVRQSMKHLAKTQLVDAAGADQAVVYGISAGALGSVFGVNIIDEFLGSQRNKVMILDSPGLHFSSWFLKAFSTEMLADLERALQGIGLELILDDANFAKHAPQVCRRFSDWQVGILQGSRDFIMSTVFSGMSPYTHERMVYGSDGIIEATGESVQNCSSWVPQTVWHGFLSLDRTATSIQAGGINALQFTSDVINGTNANQSYR